MPTLRKAPAGLSPHCPASVARMARAGLIRSDGRGGFAFLPLGNRALRKLAELAQCELAAVGALEVSGCEGPPAVGLAEALGDQLLSYRQLPLILCQLRPHSRQQPIGSLGLFGCRQWWGLEVLALCADGEQQDSCSARLRRALERALGWCGVRPVWARVVPAPGQDGAESFVLDGLKAGAPYVRCIGCGRAAAREAAEVAPAAAEPDGPLRDEPLREVDTPGLTTIAQVGGFLGVGPDRMIKTLIYLADGRPVAVLVRGDHEVSEWKLARLTGASAVQLAGADVIERLTGAPVGFAGPVGLKGVEVICDYAAAGVRGAVTGANRADAHLVGVVLGRDFTPDRTADVRHPQAGDRCARCGAALEFFGGAELARLAGLADGAEVCYMDPEGRRRQCRAVACVLDLTASLAAVCERCGDAAGISWPPAVAPHQAVVMPLDVGDQAICAAAEEAWRDLLGAGIDVLLDDRDESAGVKFNDADLVGFPVRVVIGKLYGRTGCVEVQVRRDGARLQVRPEQVAAAVKEKLEELAALCASA